jgi:hypothetical protein
MGVAAAQQLAAEGAQELVVAVERGATAAALLRSHRARSLGGGLWLVSPSAAGPALEQLRRAGALRYAHPNGRGETAGDPSDPAPWWVPRIGADRVAAPAAGGFPLTVVDAGIDTTHPEFAGRPIGFVNANSATPPNDFHGTMVASVAAAPLNGVGMSGVYPAANLRSADFGGLTCGEVLTSLDAAMDAGPSVINMSFSFTPPIGCLALYERLIQAFGEGSLLVASAGNSRQQGSPPGVPAVLPHVVTVGATNSADGVASFSNRDIGLDLVAPGDGITLATPLFNNPTGYTVASGTSFSAPMVSAAASWAMTQRPGLDVTQAFDLLRLGTRDLAPQGWDADTGFGMLDLPTLLTRPVPSVDPQEPNDDVNQVKAGGLFRTATPPLTRPGRGRAVIGARVDWTEDPVDVYRVFVPGKRTVRLAVSTSADVNLELFRPSARTVYYQNRRAALRGPLIGGSYKRGRATERFAVVNRGRRGLYAYVCVFKAEEATLDAGYVLTVTTRRK